MTALAFDIKGAFDKVIDHCLIQRLLDQKLPLPFIWWVSSFLNNRTVAIRLDRRTDDQKLIKIAVSQGCPMAHILFMLFTAPLFKLFQRVNKVAGLTIRGYVDDGLLTVSAISENASTENIPVTFGKVEK